MKPRKSVPPLMCAYESTTDYVSFGVSEVPRTFEQAKQMETKQIKQIEAPGWSFAAAWPTEGNFLRVQYWLVDSKGYTLVCKMGSERGQEGIDDLVEVCESAKDTLYQAA